MLEQNDMYPYKHGFPSHLPKLTKTEEMLISRIHVVINTFFLGKSYHLPHLQSDLPVIVVLTQQLSDCLTRLPYNLPVIVVHKTNQTCQNGFKKL